MKKQDTHHTEKRKETNIEHEKQKILQQKDQIIKNFLDDIIKDPRSGKNRQNIISKTYQDGSRYEGEVKNELRNGKGKKKTKNKREKIEILNFNSINDIFCCLKFLKESISTKTGIFIWEIGRMTFSMDKEYIFFPLERDIRANSEKEGKMERETTFT